MCSPCWQQVPEELRAEVYRTWRAWVFKRSSGSAAKAYRDARDAAIESVKA